MSSIATPDDIAKRAWLAASGEVDVCVRTIWLGGVCFPDEEGEDSVNAVFSVFTFLDNRVLEEAVSSEIEVDGGKGRVTTVDYEEFRRLMLKKCLLRWSLDIPIERENGWMTAGCYRRVGSVFAPVVDALLDEYQKTIHVSDDEEETISRQCAILFSEHSHGVANACEAVEMFCTLSGFWEKFGLDSPRLFDVPYKDIMRLKIMMRREGEHLSQRMRPKESAPTKIAGAGGRVRTSTGKRIPL